MIDAWELLICPRCGGKLNASHSYVVCASGHRYPVVEGVAVLLRDDVGHTIGLAERSLTLARAWADGRRDDPHFIDTLGLSGTERDAVRADVAEGVSGADPVASHLVAATNGILYKHLAGKLTQAPVPELRMSAGEGRRLVDIGCSWGRWSLAAAAKGWRPIGVDPSLGAVLAARRLAAVHGQRIEVVVGDARHLPLATSAVDAAFSYSVLQHFAQADARGALEQLARVVRPGGAVRVQMASGSGLRSLQHLVRRRFRQPTGFEVRYWSPMQLLRTCRAIFGDGRLEVDCYFGLGLQPTDRALYAPLGRMVLSASEGLRRASRVVPPLKLVADSVYLVANNKRGVSQA